MGGALQLGSPEPSIIQRHKNDPPKSVGKYHSDSIFEVGEQRTVYASQRCVFGHGTENQVTRVENMASALRKELTRYLSTLTFCSRKATLGRHKFSTVTRVILYREKLHDFPFEYYTSQNVNMYKMLSE